MSFVCLSDKLPAAIFLRLGPSLQAARHMDFVILDSPTCLDEVQPTIHVSYGEKVEIKCNISSIPPPIQVYWSHNSTENGLRKLPKSIYDLTTLTFTPHTHIDYGLLLCWAKNSLGKQEKPCKIKVAPVGKESSITIIHFFPLTH